MTHPTVFNNRKYLFAVYEPEHQKCFVPNRRFFLSSQANNKLYGQFIQSNWIKKEIYPDQGTKNDDHNNSSRSQCRRSN